MMKAEASLKFIHEKVEKLRNGAKPHERAAHTALARITELWDRPLDGAVDADLAMAEQIGQDLAELSRHIANIQHDYMKALFTDTK